MLTLRFPGGGGITLYLDNLNWFQNKMLKVKECLSFKKWLFFTFSSIHYFCFCIEFSGWRLLENVILETLLYLQRGTYLFDK